MAGKFKNCDEIATTGTISWPTMRVWPALDNSPAGKL